MVRGRAEYGDTYRDVDCYCHADCDQGALADMDRVANSDAHEYAHGDTDLDIGTESRSAIGNENGSAPRTCYTQLYPNPDADLHARADSKADTHVYTDGNSGANSSA